MRVARYKLQVFRKEEKDRFPLSWGWHIGKWEWQKSKQNEDERYKGSNEIATGSTQVILSAPLSMTEELKLTIFTL